MKFGICTSPAALGEQLVENIEKLKAAGAEYLEFPVASVQPDQDRKEFEELKTLLADAPLTVEAFNGFLPKTQRITGPDVDLRSVLEFAHVALSRCKEIGGDVVVLGSSGARKVPEGFDMSRAREQFIEFCREVAPIAESAGIAIAIEPLNAKEDNLILTVADGARIVDEVNHPSIQLLADFYHMMEEDEPLQNVVKAGERLRHTHLADIGRVVPGFAAEGEADFVGFFRALKDSGYTQSEAARCSFEGRYEDLFSQATPMFALLRERYAAV